MKINFEFVVYKSPMNNFGIEWSLFVKMGFYKDSLMPRGDSFKLILDTVSNEVRLSKEMVKVDFFEMEDHHLILNKDPFEIRFAGSNEIDFKDYSLYNTGDISLFIPIDIKVESVI